MTAADVRRHVMTGSLLLHPQAAFSVDTADSTSHMVNLIEVVEPLDVEDILSQRKSSSSIYEHTSTNTSPRRVAEFPVDDVEVRLVHRDQLTVESPFPAALSGVDAVVRDIIRTYNDDFSLVHRRYQQFSSGEAYLRVLMERPVVVQSMQRQIYEVETERTVARSASIADEQGAKRDSYGSHYSSDSMCTVGSSSGGTARDETTVHPPHQLHSSASDPTVPGVIQRISNAQLDQINEARRQSNRQSSIVNLLPVQPESEVIERRSPAPFPVEHAGQKLLIKVLQVSPVEMLLEVEPNFEPIFGSIALYDVKEKRKISENFYFDLNDDWLRAMISKHVGREDEASKCTQAVFSISQSIADVFIVVKLEKVLQACEVADASDPYLKEERNKERLVQTAKAFCDRLGAYRMPLGWIAIDLSKVLCGAHSLEKIEVMAASTMTVTSQQIRGTESTPNSPGPHYDTESIISAGKLLFVLFFYVVLDCYCIYFLIVHHVLPVVLFDVSEVALRRPRCWLQFRNAVHPFSDARCSESERLSDDDLCKMLIESRKGGSKLARLKTFPAKFKLEISGNGIEECPMRWLTPELLRVHPYVPGNSSDIVKEIAEFPTKGVYAVNACYRNLLYVYPRFANLSNRSGASRNISLRVELMDAHERPMQLVFGKSSCPDVSAYANTAVCYHNKTPTFYDEIKIALPVDLNDGHHLLFTFCHITCKQNKVGDEVETPIGYSWVPLYKDGRLQTGEFTLPIALERLPTSYGYLSPDVNLPNVKWLDGHKPLFSVSLEAITTVHTQDHHLDTFLFACQSLSSTDKKNPPVSEMDLKNAIRGVIKARPEPMVAFLYVVLDKLLALVVNPPYSVSVSGCCFEVLGHLVKICTVLLDGFCDAHGRSSLLTTYVQYHKIALKESTILPQYVPTRPNREESTAHAPSSPESQHLFDIIKDFERSNCMRAIGESDERGATKKVMHEELALQWVMSGGAAREMAFLNAWFFLELMVKSMAEYLSLSNRLYLPRKLRFGDAFIQDLNALSQAMVGEVVKRTSKDPRQSQSINASWAFFLRDSFSLMDRSFVMNLVKQYNRELAAKIVVSSEPCTTTLMLLKLDFVRIISSHEHFVVLNLPLGLTGPYGMVSSHSGGSFHSASPALTVASSGSSEGSGTATSGSIGTTHSSAPQLQPPSPSNSSLSSRASSQAAESHGSVGSAELTADFRSRHFIIGLALADLAAVLETPNTLLHARAVGLIRNLLSSHEADSRLLDASVKSRVASLYLPLVGIVLDASSQLYDPYARGCPSRGSIGYAIASSFSNSRSFAMETESGIVNDKVMMAIGGLSSSPPCSPPVERTRIPLIKPTLSLEITRQLVACLCWAIKNMDRTTLRQWIRELSPSRLLQFLDVLQLAVSCFEFKCCTPAQASSDAASEEIRQKLEEAIIGNNSSAKELLRKKSRGAVDNDGIRWRKEALGKNSWKSNAYSSGCHSSEEQPINEQEIALEASLCTEVSLTVLDTLEILVRVLSVPGSDHLFFVLPSVLRVIMHMLACNQSVHSLENIFASQRALVIKYPDLLFEQETEQCGELCLHLLRHCASRLPAVRSQAAASLYLLMRQSFESGANLSKVKMQITMSLSTLVSTGTRHGDWINEDCLRRSLKTVLTYSETDASTDAQLRSTTFSEQVKDLVFNLHMILSDTVKMKEYTNDFEMLIDLMYRVAKGYQNNPDLRLTWLINMANKHAARENAAEAAECMLHASALAAEYISMRHHEPYLPKGAVAFAEISDNILEESAVSDDVISADEEGICESRHFTENGLVHLVEKTAQFMEKAQMYEMMPLVYKVITPILEQNRDYRRLAQIHNRLSDALSRIEPTVPLIEDIADAWYSPSPSADKRCFGTYFRVGFYGNRFGDLDGAEFIYKEPAITKLSEVSHRLEAFYTDRFGKGVVEVIKDSNIVERSRLELSKAYLQITYVEPYLERWERRRRPTHFERNHKLNRFVYATPFTKDGRPHGDLGDQYKRRTVLTTQYSFPYVKTRLRVINREQTVLTPIEVAIEDVQKKTRELAAATAQDPPDAKMLQMVLQGCIGTTVNQGPVQVANVFLTSVVLDERGKPIDKLQNKLRLCFKDFSKKCADALHKNKQLIQADQQAYQNELQKNYIEFTKRMAPIVGSGPARKVKSLEGHTLRAAHAAALAAELGPVTAV
uniref:Dedicator of cytokinesis protein 7 n=1 Tax=Ascaris lumbricoides TaxID=6252 RepID=A0A9J2PJV5_ASCLU